MYIPRNEHLDLLVRIKFQNLFLDISKLKSEKFTVLIKSFTGAHSEDCMNV